MRYEGPNRPETQCYLASEWMRLCSTIIDRQL